MTDTERCDREIAEILERPDVVSGQAPAWLVVLGTGDWEEERKMIMENQRQELRARYMREANGASWIDWIEDLLLATEARIAELTADESPRQAAERIVQSHLNDSSLDNEDLAQQITTAIQAASNAQLERGRAKIAELESELKLSLATVTRLNTVLAKTADDLEYLRGEIDGLRHTAQVSVEDAYANRHIQHVREFMERFQQHIGEAPGFPPQEVMDLRVKLIAEEFAELLEAGRYGFTIHINRYSSEEDQMHFGTCSGLRYHKGPDFPAFIDALLDLEYVILGTHVSCGVDPQPIWEAVHAANIAKIPAAEPNGKIQKPQGFQAPDIAGVLKDQGWGGSE